MPKNSFQNWLTIQEHRKGHSIFLVEWLSLFAMAWLFWILMFFNAPGSVPPGLAATLIAILYASCLVYGRLLRATSLDELKQSIRLERYLTHVDGVFDRVFGRGEGR